MSTMPAKPLPDVNDSVLAPFWQGTREGRLLLPRCTNCGYLQWPPEALCPECQHPERTWEEFPAEGVLWSYAVYHRALDPAFADDLPYAVGLVELDCGRKMYGMIAGDHSRLEIGRRMRGVFERVTDEVTFLRWSVAEADSPA